jgi:hypothetical protein
MLTRCLGQAQGIHEPSVIASLFSNTEELGMDASEIDHDIKYTAFTLVTGMYKV